MSDDRHIAERLARVIADGARQRPSGGPIVDRGRIIDLVERTRRLLFPELDGHGALDARELADHLQDEVARLANALRQPIEAGLHYRDKPPADPAAEATRISNALLAKLPEIRGVLALDVQAAYDGDPAARHTDEIILAYPGIDALSVHRIAHELYRADVPLVPRIMAEHAHGRTGIDIHPGATIGRSFFIDHGTGVVIGETTIIGDHCCVYQGVTLGARGFELDESGRVKRGGKRHPTLEDHVAVYAGATILGGDTVIGAGSVVNGGVFLTSSVPPGHVVRGPKLEITLRSNPKQPPGSYAI